MVMSSLVLVESCGCALALWSDGCAGHVERPPRVRPRTAARPRRRTFDPLAGVPPGGSLLDIFGRRSAGRLPPRSADRPQVIDFGARSTDVRRLTRSQHGGLYAACLRAGWVAEELDQELLLWFVRRQAMGSRYDPTRGSFSKYIVTNSRGMLLNFLEKAKRRAHVGLSDDGIVDGTSWDADPFEVDEVEFDSEFMG